MQENYAADPETAEEIRAFVREFDKRFNNERRGRRRRALH